jgi:hypothetical protein
MISSSIGRVKFQAELAELIGKYGIGKAVGVRDDVLANSFLIDLEALQSIKVLESTRAMPSPDQSPKVEPKL